MADRGRSMPVWKCPELASEPFSDKQVLAALKASQMLEMGLNYSPPRCSFRDYVRFLQVLRFVRTDIDASDPNANDIPVAVVSLPQPAILANLQLSLAQRVPDYVDYTDRIVFALSTAADGSSGPRQVRSQQFRLFLTTVMSVVGRTALNGDHSRHFRVAGDTHVLDAIADFEWRRLRAGPSGCLSKTAVSQRLIEFALLLCSSTASFAPQVPLLVLELLDGLFLPAALSLTTQPTITQRLQITRGAIPLLPPASTVEPGRVAAAAPNTATTGPTFSVPTTTLASSADVTTTREKTRELFPPRKRQQPALQATASPPDLSPRSMVPHFDGMQGGLNAAANVEQLHTFLRQFAVEPTDDSQQRMDKQFLQREGRRLMDSYPTQNFKNITMTLGAM